MDPFGKVHENVLWHGFPGLLLSGYSGSVLIEFKGFSIVLHSLFSLKPRRSKNPRSSLMKYLAAFVMTISIALSPCTAAATLAVKWDCYLPGPPVDCVSLETSLRSKIPFLKIVTDALEADVAVTITSVPAEDATRIKCDIVGKRVEGYATEVHTTDKIPSSIDPTTATVRILTKLERGLDDFMDQRVASEMENDALTIRVFDPTRPPYTGRPEQGVKWYIAPGVSTYFSDVQGVGINASGTASVPFNYSARSWRVQQSMGANYSHQSQPVPGTGETASIHFVGGSANNVLAWSLAGAERWTAGLLFSGEKKLQANYRLRGNASVGIEFDLVPRQTVNQKNFGFRCATGPEFQRYDETNLQGRQEQVVTRQFCDVFFGWHFQPIDIGAWIGENTVLGNFDYRSFAGGLGATWRLTNDFVISPWLNLQQINKAINEAAPTNAVYANARQEIEASMLASARSGYTAPFGVQSGLTIRYLFGNGSLASEDQRWKNVNNLR